jgi:hypothetical protein
MVRNKLLIQCDSRVEYCQTVHSKLSIQRDTLIQYYQMVPIELLIQCDTHVQYCQLVRIKLSSLIHCDTVISDGAYQIVESDLDIML